jgi:hypothetical protein
VLANSIAASFKGYKPACPHRAKCIVPLYLYCPPLKTFTGLFTEGGESEMTIAFTVKEPSIAGNLIANNIIGQ